HTRASCGLQRHGLAQDEDLPDPYGDTGRGSSVVPPERILTDAADALVPLPQLPRRRLLDATHREAPDDPHHGRRRVHEDVRYFPREPHLAELDLLASLK